MEGIMPTAILCFTITKKYFFFILVDTSQTMKVNDSRRSSSCLLLEVEIQEGVELVAFSPESNFLNSKQKARHSKLSKTLMDSVCTLRSAQGVNIKHSKAKLDSMAWYSWATYSLWNFRRYHDSLAQLLSYLLDQTHVAILDSEFQ